jgi:hypothetical protein
VPDLQAGSERRRLDACALWALGGGAAVVESIAVIPGNNDSGQVYNSINRDEVWMIVNRTINGATKRYIEMMEGYFDGPNRATYLTRANVARGHGAAQVDAFYVDCGLTYSGRRNDDDQQSEPSRGRDGQGGG